MNIRRFDIAIVCGLAGILLLFFYQTIFFGKLPIPTDTLVGLYHPWRDFYSASYPRGVPFKNFLITDPIRQQIPWRKAAIDTWRSGHIPNFNPSNFSGTLLAGNIQAAVFYPFNFLFFLFTFPMAWTILIILEPVLSSVFFYMYARGRQFSSFSSIVGAISWSLCGFTIAWLTWGTIVHAALWLPLILFSIDKLLGKKTQYAKMWFLLLVAGLVMSMLAGHIQISLYVVVLCGAYGAWQIYTKQSDIPNNQKKWFIGAFLLAVLIASIQWIPLVALIAGSGRIGQSNVWEGEGWFLPWEHLIQFAVPDFFGNPATLNYWGKWNYGEFIGYVGIMPLVLALYGAIFLKDKESVFWKIIVLLAFAGMVASPIAKLPYILKFPIFSSIQPTRLMVIVDFSLCMLCVHGLDDWIKKRDRKLLIVALSFFVIIGITVGLVWIGSALTRDSHIIQNLSVSKRNLFVPIGLALACLGWIGCFDFFKTRKYTYFWKGLFITIVIFDLFRFGWKFTPFTPVDYFFPTTPTLTFLMDQSKPFRVLSLDSRLLPPNVSSYYGIESIEGYDPLYASRYEEFVAAIGRGNADITPPFGFNRIITTQNIDSPLIRLLNVRFVLSLSEIERPNLQKVFQEGETRVYALGQSMPRAYFVQEAKFIQGRQNVINALYQTKDFYKTAYVETPVDVVGFPLSMSENASIETYESSYIKLHVTAQVKRLLVLSQIYDTHWKATIDGEKASIVSTNFLFGGIVVPSGIHTIELFYTWL